MTFPIIPASTVNGSYQISRSLRFRSSATAYLSRTFGTATDSKKFYFACSVKRGALGSSQTFISSYNGSASDFAQIYFDATDHIVMSSASGGVTGANVTTSAVFRDPSAWYLVECLFDSTLTTAADRTQIWVNGVRQSVTGTTVPSNAIWHGNTAVVNNIARTPSAGNYADFYLAEINCVDGQSLTLPKCGAFDTNGVWQPARYTGSYGTNGFYLPFSDNSTETNVLTGNVGLGKDFSGNGNFWTTNNVSLAGSTVQSFTSVGTTSWTAPAGVTSVRYLVVGGGGGGGYSIGGGGGGGGVLEGTLSVTPGNSYTVTVGGGGAAATSTWGGNGGNSVFSSITALGGGGGGGNSLSYYGQNGSSGGGAGEGASYGSGTTGQGFRGGSAYDAGANYGSGGGGGAGGIGADGTSAGGGNGGPGIAATITGSTVYYGGGGGGGMYPAGSAGSGGVGGGGAAAVAGTANTGGGGGGATLGGSNSAAGGSGIVIITYGSGVTYDSVIDVPTNYADSGTGRGNYPTGNPVFNAATITNGNLLWQANQIGNPAVATFTLPTSGKWYWEATISTVADIMVGVQKFNNIAYSGPKTAYYRAGGASNGIYIEGTANAYSPASYTTNDVIGVAFNADASQITWYKNNTQQGGPFSLTSITDLVPIIIQASSTLTASAYMNFGQQGFAYTPPSGYSSLNTQNLPTPVIAAGNKHFDVVTRGGTGGVYTKTGLGFQPDFAWTKLRNTAYNHYLQDAVRGVAKQLSSDTTAAEQSITNAYTAFNADGYTLGSSTAVNDALYTYVDWLWNAGGSTISNTAGSITSQVRANPTAGFSVVTFTAPASGAYTFGHGLNVAPQLVISKERNAAGIWSVYHTGSGSSRLQLESTAAGTAGVWTTLPTSTTVWLPSSYADSNQRVAYCFAPIAGYSAFGSYVGTGADGPFIYLGFRPRWIMIKNATANSSSAYGSWKILDTSRDTYNGANPSSLWANASYQEGLRGNGSADTYIEREDFLSNGFKLGGASSYEIETNESGVTYIYAAFAEVPFKYARAR